METPIEGLVLLHMRESGVEGLIIILRFIFSPAGIFRPYIEFRETHESSFSFLDVHSGSPQDCCPDQYGFIKNFEAKSVWHTAYLVPKNMGNSFHKKMIKHKQFPVWYNLVQLRLTLTRF